MKYESWRNEERRETYKKKKTNKGGKLVVKMDWGGMKCGKLEFTNLFYLIIQSRNVSPTQFCQLLQQPQLYLHSVPPDNFQNRSVQ